MGTLNDLPIGKTATVVAVGGEGSLRQHFLDMGIIPQADVAMVKHAPMGDPVEVRIHGYELTLRRDDARKIEVADEREADAERLGGARPRRSFAERVEHPGLGEGGKFHDRDAERPLPEGEPLTFALVGNQNCGKTTLFNQLTGANQHVGNFPGVTVDRKDGRVRGHAEATVTDLPGIYSLSPYSSEEVVTRQFLLDERPRGIINIVDATNVERNLYLTMQLLELGVPMVVALNMMDEVEGNGGTIRVNEMEKLLGVPVVPISASKNEGIGELVDHALHVARYQEPPVCQDFCAADAHGGAVHRCLHGIMALVGDHAERAGIPVRFAASKLAEGDALVLEKLALDENEKHLLGHIVRQLEDERGLDRAAAIADMRFAFIERVCDECVVRPRVSREHARSMALDKLLTGTFTAIPAFVAIMALVFWLTFNVVGAWMSEMLEAGIGWLTDVVANALAAAQVNEVLQSLVIDGVFNGVGSVVGFLPTIVTLFFFLSLLEDSGYMARVAFVMDKLLRKIGLSGRSIVPMLVGFGCTVPAVMAARTLPSERDRKMTIMLTPFMSCSAKLPIYAFFTAAFFPASGAAVMVGLYFGGMAVGVLAALLMRKSLFSGEAVPFVMELPNYRMPSARNVGQLLWEKAKDFLERAFTIIFIATIVIWFLQTFDFGLNVVADSADSMLAVVAGWIAPVFAPLGFDDWRISTALVTGVMAKESVVSTLSVLFGSTASLVAALTPLAALGLLVFCLLYTPCVAAIASVRRELGGRWALAMVFGQFAVAWLAALAVRGAGLAMELPAGEAWSVAVGAAVAVAVALVLRRMARRRRAGAGGCGGGCAGGCAGCSATTCAGCAQEGESRPKPPDAETLAESRR
ncbi:MAG: ferrous iron transport protein B [Gordonibacter pamelaeae]|uniref:Ferrous iron transport protein B n=4 Tax=Gordonibacter TaxID=644652 RepID=A0A6N8ILC0_9ACTN|nr:MULTISPECIES: ferrous iron transport protein B [Gordonibacter]MBS4895633.1 ferrous iron transport protein B [Gordonibacter pamelaeae]MCB6311500.1 ferrous iron transport protein B [Gordonibacter pamelaeae]MVM56162.1 ferrous iron transport protein B [Gordonibacter urolithinfaciens]MVN16694.1 ferrous iron transport protein B [Gordonibacter urolithinfaciens]MVN40209.1 ferrous iron transport protein B [Gordonibacter urolithinfaciens]